MLIVITLPYFFPNEVAQIKGYFRNGLEILHLRKPEAYVEEIVALIEQIPSEYHPRIVLHDHHELAIRYGLKGIHLNSRNPSPPEGFKGDISRSCHTLEEIQRYKSTCNYLFLSPVFDSISKSGYRSAFTYEQLIQASEEGIIDEKVIALGGVTLQHLNQLIELGFGGGAMMGAAWKE